MSTVLLNGAEIEKSRAIISGQDRDLFDRSVSIVTSSDLTSAREDRRRRRRNVMCLQ